MPGLVAVKTPPDVPPPRISVSEIRAEQSTPITSLPRSKPPSPSPSSRSKLPSPSPAQTRSGNKKPPPDVTDASLDNPDLGPFLLKLARDTIASGEGPTKALDYAIRATKSFERCASAEAEPSLDYAMSLHVLAAIYCSLGRFEEAVPVLEQAISVPDTARGADHALAKYSGYMQLGDTYSMLGQVDRSIGCYEEGLKIQIEALGDKDPRVVETCRFLFFFFLIF